MDHPLPIASVASPNVEARRLRRRRRLLAVVTGASFLAALLAMARMLGGDGLGAADVTLLLCFALMLPWNLLGFWNAAIGLALLHGSQDPVAAVTPAAGQPATGPLKARTAIVMPVFNEDPQRVFRHLEATMASLDASGEGEAFTVFVLSDTKDPRIAAEEEALVARCRARSRTPARLHYRRRARNDGHKTGNLWEWLERRGQDFDHMLVLDADSVMSGEAILRLVRIMEAHPRIGILQQLIVGLPNLSPFARLFQFGMRHGMRAFTMGSAWWQGDCGPYWGHNALIRIAPFMVHCRLPTLPGRPPLGGRVLSHDQLEAVLMRRAGFEVRVLPEEEGSFEENPPTLSDFIKRDLRWCQGNWQYLHLVARPGLHLMGRLQLLLAILMYISGPAWMLFSLVGFARAMLPGPPEAAPALLGQPAAWEGWALLGAMMAVVFAPKLAGVAQVLLTRRLRRLYGGGWRVLASALAELLFSFVLAPIVAVAQTIFVLGMAVGRTIRWEAQHRDTRSLPWREALRGLWPQTLAGLALIAAVWTLAPAGARAWALLLGGPLALAVPFAVLTSWVGWGVLLARWGIAAVPEELAPPPVVTAAGHARLGRPASPRPAPLPASSGAAPVEAPAAPPVD